MNALGMIEVYSFTTALCAADLMAKTADIRIIAFDRNRPFAPKIPAPLIMAVKIEGSVAAVKAAVAAGEEYAKSKGMFIVSHIIARPAEDTEKMAYLMDINKDKFNKKLPKNMLGVEADESVRCPALGVLEVSGFTAAVVGLDSMLKAADVRLVHKEERLGGRLVSLIVKGSVSSVDAALGSGQKTADPIGKVYGCENISNPHPELLKFFDLSIAD